MTDDQLIYNITIKRGADYTVDVIVAEDDEAPIDLSGWTAEAQVREFPESNEAESFTCSVDVAGIHLTMPRSTVDRLGYTQGKYDLFITDPDNSSRTRLIHGIAYVIPEVTR